MKQSRVLTALSAMAHARRLEIVRLLVPLGEKGLPAGAIAARIGISASALSFHLSALEQAGLIASRRVSRQVIYSADNRMLGNVIRYLRNDCCGAHPEICARCDDPVQSDGTVKT